MKRVCRLVVVLLCGFTSTACNEADRRSNNAPPPILPGSVDSRGNGGGIGGDGGGGENTPVFAQEFSAVDLHTRATPALPAGEIELVTLSTFPDAVSGGDVLIALRGVPAGESPRLTLNGTAISPVFTTDSASGELRALVSNLVDGANTLQAAVGSGDSERRVSMTVRNHPITGPIISGPHQTPFRCRTVDAGLGAPLDANCSAATQYQWYYRRMSNQQYAELDPAATSYPQDLQTTVTKDGEVVPFIVRVESATINRGIARIAVLDDPIARGGAEPFQPSWNKRVYYIFGESCGVGYDQGVNTTQFVLGAPPESASADSLLINFVGGSERLSEGDIVVHSTLSAFGVHCNPFVSMETTMMLKEHITEQYGVPVQFIGTNGSGAALQQYNAANNAPGLLTAALPTATFTDIASTAMTVTDCGLLINYFDKDPVTWGDPRKQAAVTGHTEATSITLQTFGAPQGLATRICESWVTTFFDRVKPSEGCDHVPTADRYDAATNPSGVRCTIQDANVNWLGIDPATGFARRPLDNEGVQYGLKALRDGVITPEEFLDLNANIGGLDIDGNFTADQPGAVKGRHAMAPELVGLLYRIGQVIGRGSLAETPIIDIAPYLDLIPQMNIHETVRPFNVRARRALQNARADQDITRVIWRGTLTQPDVFEQIDAWTENLSGLTPSGNRVKDVAAARPADVVDTCSFSTTGGQLDFPDALRLPLGGNVPLIPGAGVPGGSQSFSVNAAETWNADGSGTGPCANLLPVVKTPRIAADMPMSDDVLKCQLKSVAQAVSDGDYAGRLNSNHIATLETIFPEGVCDYSKPGVGDMLSTQRSIRWPTIGGSTLLTNNGKLAPKSLQWRAVRSRAEP